jgi:membrane fusion protein (multidrug efflux system)
MSESRQKKSALQPPEEEKIPSMPEQRAERGPAKTPSEKDRDRLSGAAPGKKKIGRKGRLLIIGTVVLVVLGVGGFLYWEEFLRKKVSTNDAYIDGHRIAISAEILGRIDRLTADEGDEVKSGQLLVHLDESSLSAQRDLAEANISLAEQNVNLAKVSLSLAQDDYNRTAAQFKDKITTQSQFDHAQKTLEMAQVKYDLALNQVKSSRAELQVIQTQLAYCRIASPIDGIVAKRWVLPGDVVQPSQPILTIYDNSGVWVTVMLEETKISSVHLGDSVEISVDAYSKKKFSGQVILIGAAAASQFSLIPPDNASGNFTKVTQRIPIRVSIDPRESPEENERQKLLPGMSASIKVKVK